MPHKPQKRDSLKIIAFGAMGAFLATSFSSCTSTKASARGAGADELAPIAIIEEESEEVPENFNYCPVDSVTKSTKNSAGLAALTSVLNYWDTDASEPELVKAYPSDSVSGHDMHQLQRIAIDKGLTAFSLTMKAKPLAHLSEQLEHGRPILVTVRFPDGTYFGQSAAEMAQVAQSAGSDAVAPTINKDQEHFVVVFGQSDKQFLLMDPTFGVLSIDKESFVKYWKEEQYSALLCST